MSARILDGNICSKNIRDELREKIQSLPRPPHLSIIMVGDDPRSQVYVMNKMKAAKDVGIECSITDCSKIITTEGLLQIVRHQSWHAGIDAFIVQFPLPPHIDAEAVILAIDPNKDADCFHPSNQGLLPLRGTPKFIPATPLGIIELLKRHDYTTSGKRVAVVGHSTIVGRPLRRRSCFKAKWATQP